MKCLVFNGWAAGHEAWDLCTFAHDWVFNYVEQLDGLPERVLEESEEAVLVGFSMGGSSALRMLLAYPEKVKGLVLVSTTPCMMERKDEGWPGMSARRLAALKLGTELVFRNDPSPMYDRVNMNRGLDYLLQTDLRASLVAAAARKDWNGMPVRIFQSDKDGIVRPQNADFLKSVFPQAEVRMIPGNEHVLPVTVPELIDDAVTATLREASGARPGSGAGEPRRDRRPV